MITEESAIKKESARRIRERIVGSSYSDVDKNANENIEITQNLSRIASSIEKLSNDQVEIFEKMLMTLEDIPKSVREKDRQNDLLKKQMAQVIQMLRDDLRSERDAARKEKISSSIRQLVDQGETLSRKPSIPSLRRPESFLERMGTTFMRFKPQDVSEMRMRGGGIGGLLGAYGAGLKRETKALFGISDRPRTFARQMADEEMRMQVSQQINEDYPSTRRDRVRENLERVADYNVARRDPVTGEYYRISRSGTRIEEFTESGKVNPQFDPAGLTVKTPEEKKDDPSEILQGIIESTKRTAKVLEEIRDGDKKDRLEKAKIAASMKTRSSRSGTDFDQEKNNQQGIFGASSFNIDSLSNLIGNTAGGIVRLLGRFLTNPRFWAVTLAVGAGVAFDKWMGSEEESADEKIDAWKKERDKIISEMQQEEVNRILNDGITPDAENISNINLEGLSMLMHNDTPTYDNDPVRQRGAELNRLIREREAAMDTATNEQRRSLIGNNIETVSSDVSGTTAPIINNVDNSQRVINNYGTDGTTGSGPSISVRNEDSSFIKYQERGLSRPLR